jgi:hypothetical protein
VIPTQLVRPSSGPDHRLQRPARPEYEIELVQVADGVDLEEVEAVGLEPLQAVVDLGPGGVAVAQPGLGGQEDPVSDVARKIRSRIRPIQGPSRSSASP